MIIRTARVPLPKSPFHPSAETHDGASYEGNMKKYTIIGILFALVLLASVARAAETVEQNDLADIFQGFDGTFIMYDEGADRYTVFNKALSETRLPPCSTFKVFHALIGLDSGVLDRDDACTLMKWNGKPSSIAAWNHDPRRWPRPCAIRWSGISSASQRASERNGCSGSWTVSATATATFPGV